MTNIAPVTLVKIPTKKDTYYINPNHIDSIYRADGSPRVFFKFTNGKTEYVYANINRVVEAITDNSNLDLNA